MARKKPQDSSDALKGWKAIAAFLGIPAGSAQRWARDVMPVHSGRFTVTDPKELSAWLGREAHMPGPAKLLTDQTDVAEALKESIAASRRVRKG
jgi:hypothetical protein